MKIIILVRILWTAGTQKIAIAEATQLANEGHDVELVFLRGSKMWVADELLKGVKYTVISKDGESFFSPLYGFITHIFAPNRGSESRVDFNLIRKFPKYVRSKNVDYIICHDQFAGIAGYYCWKKLKIKYSVFLHELLITHDVPILGRLWKWYELKVLNNATKIFAVTDAVNRSVAKHVKIKVITNWPGMDVNSNVGFEFKKDIIIAAAFWDAGRRPNVYLDLLESLSNFTLYFIGNWHTPKLKEDFIQSIKQKNLSDRIVMKYGIDESELGRLYDESKFSIRFGFGEGGVGTSTIESIQHCVPVIVNRDLGISDLIAANNCGLVLSNIDRDAVRDFLSKNNNQVSYQELQNRIRDLASSHSWKEHARILVHDISEADYT